MKFLAIATLLLTTKAFSAPLPTADLPESCRLKTDVVEVGQIYGARVTKTYRYQPSICYTIGGTPPCVYRTSEYCDLEREELELTRPDGQIQSYGKVDEICRDYRDENLKGTEVKCESKVGRTITYGGSTPICSESVQDLDITVYKKLVDNELKDAKCKAIESCLESGLGYFERRNAARWSNYYGCHN